MSSFSWQEQWKHHAPDYHHDLQLAVVDVTKWAPQAKEPFVKLRAGPGFGDLSHSTTRLGLQMMAKRVSGAYVVDIGCGSGVLGLCALAMGALFVYAVDIDLEALEHTRENAALNGKEAQCLACLAEHFPSIPSEKRWVLLMNMIRTEQQEAWKSLPFLHGHPAEIITSGILAEDRDTYLALTQTWGWELVEEREEDGWLGFYFMNLSK